jgi:hypothetical protein
VCRIKSGLALPQRCKPRVQGSAEISPFGAVFPSPRDVAPPDASRLLWRIVLRRSHHEIPVKPRLFAVLRLRIKIGSPASLRTAFALEDGVIYHTYSTYARGLDGLWGMYQWLDRAPKGRNETGVWWRRHDEYDKR